MYRDMRDIDVLDVRSLTADSQGYSGFASDFGPSFTGKPKVQVENTVYTLSKVPTEAANWWEYRAAAYIPNHLVVIFNT